MKRRTISRRVLSVVLTAVLILGAFPLSVSAAAEVIEEAVEETVSVSESKIVREVTQLRDEKVKHFLCEDGTYIAVAYSQPVHYKENGEWKEIDNSLELSSKTLSASGKATYTPKASNLSVSIPQSFSDGQQVKATNKGHTISFGVASGNKNVSLEKTAAVTAVETLPSGFKAQENISTAASSAKEEVDYYAVESYNSSITAVKNQSGAVVFEDVFPNSDLEYIVTGSSIKENIVVYEPQKEYTYSFDIDLGGLVPVAQEDGSYLIVDKNKPEETVFVLAAPYMYDALGEESLDIAMSLTPNGSTYQLTVSASEEWLNSSERAFPVVIDPTFYFEFDDVFVMDGLYADSTRTTTELRVGRNPTNLTRTYIKPTVPTNIPTGAVIENAELVLQQDYYYAESSAGTIVIFAYDCRHVEDWDPDTITWNNQPFDNSDNGYLNDVTRAIAYSYAYSTVDTYTFDVTSAARRWAQTGVCEGLMLASSDETEKIQVDFHSSSALLSSNRPTFEYTYSLPGISMSEWELTDPSAATSSDITINTSEGWSISVSDPWLSVSATSGTGKSTFTISAAENTAATQREGTVTVMMGSVKLGEVKVYQSGANAYLFLDETPIFLDYKTCSKTITVVTNATWDVSDNADWLNAEKIDSNTISISVIQENTTANTNKATVTVTAHGDLGDVPKTIAITQYDKVTCLFNTINADGTLSAISSTEYNHALATWAMELSYAAYNYPDGTELPRIPGDFMGDVDYTAADVLRGHGFSNDYIVEKNYTQADCGAHTIAYRDIEFPVAENTNNTYEGMGENSDISTVNYTVGTVDQGVGYDSIYNMASNTGSNRSTVLLSETDTTNNTRRLIVVAIRGSVTSSDWDNNFKTQFVPCDNKFAEMKDTVVDNLENHVPDLSDSIILVTGHSLGAAIANLLAAELSSTLGVENVYAYTFATPNVLTEALDSEAIPYTNIFNILNTNDVITYVPFTFWLPVINFWARHGVDIPLNMPYNENTQTDSLGVFCHSMEVYMAWMENNPNMTYEAIMAESAEARTRGILPWIVRIKCPVGVTVKDSEGNIIAYESQEGITYPEITDTGIVSWIDEDGAKVFFVPHYADAAKIEIKAYDYGDMTMSIGLLGVEETDETDETANSITYNNVKLYPGKEFEVEIAEEFVAEDIALMHVVTNEDGTKTETEITDLNPLLKSVTVDDTSVTYGTTTTITVVTDKSVDKVQFIRHGTSTTITCAKDSSIVVSVVEDGDNLIWTIQRVFTRGELIYDVKVKVGYTWYPAEEQVFALTVT